MVNRKQNIQMKFYVTEDEKRLIDEKMSHNTCGGYPFVLIKADSFLFGVVIALL